MGLRLKKNCLSWISGVCAWDCGYFGLLFCCCLSASSVLFICLSFAVSLLILCHLSACSLLFLRGCFGLS